MMEKTFISLALIAAVIVLAALYSRWTLRGADDLPQTIPRAPCGGHYHDREANRPEWQISEHDQEIMHGYETSRESAQIKSCQSTAVTACRRRGAAIKVLSVSRGIWSPDL